MFHSTHNNTQNYTSTTTASASVFADLTQLAAALKINVTTNSTLEKVNQLVAVLEVSPYIPGELKGMLAKWKVDYLKDFETLTTGEETFAAAQSLSYLYNDVIYKALLISDHDELLSYQTSLKAILYPLLPKGQEEKYAELLFTSDQSTGDMAEEIGVINQELWEKELHFIELGNQLLQNSEAHLSKVKTILSQQVESYQKNANELFAEQLALFSRVQNATEQLADLDLIAIELSSSLNAENQKLKALADETAPIFNKGVRK